MKDRNMFYEMSSSGMANTPNMPMNTPGFQSGFNQSMGMMPMPGNMNMNNMQSNDPYQLNDRISRMERQIKKLDQRLSKLENPYGVSTTTSNGDSVTIQPSFNVM